MKHLIHIGQQHSFKTRPGREPVHSGDTVKWENHLEEWVRFTFQNGDEVFTVLPNNMRIPPGTDSNPTDSDQHEVRSGATHGEYEYRVHCEQSNENADGDSDPQIIVL